MQNLNEKRIFSDEGKFGKFVTQPRQDSAVMLRLAIVLSLLLLRSDLTSSRQTWEKQPEYAEVNPGESVVLQCIINNKEGDCRYCDSVTS